MRAWLPRNGRTKDARWAREERALGEGMTPMGTRIARDGRAQDRGCTVASRAWGGASLGTSGRIRGIPRAIVDGAPRPSRSRAVARPAFTARRGPAAHVAGDEGRPALDTVGAGARVARFDRGDDLRAGISRRARAVRGAVVGGSLHVRAAAGAVHRLAGPAIHALGLHGRLHRRARTRRGARRAGAARDGFAVGLLAVGAPGQSLEVVDEADAPRARGGVLVERDAVEAE